MTQGHRGQGLTQYVQVLLTYMDSLFNRTSQIHRKQAASATHTPSTPIAVDIWHL